MRYGSGGKESFLEGRKVLPRQPSVRLTKVFVSKPTRAPRDTRRGRERGSVDT